MATAKLSANGELIADRDCASSGFTYCVGRVVSVERSSIKVDDRPFTNRRGAVPPLSHTCCGSGNCRRGRSGVWHLAIYRVPMDSLTTSMQPADSVLAAVERHSSRGEPCVFG